MQVIVNKLSVKYQLRGKGKLVLLLHGWGPASETFNKIQEQLSGEYQVLSVDLPGFGGTQLPPAAWDLDNYAQFLDDLLAKLRLNHLYAVLGHSNGGALAIRAISLNKIRPEKLILLAASGVRTNSRAKRIFFKFVAKAGNASTIWLPEHRRAALRKRLYGAAGSDMLVAPDLQDTFKRTVRQDVQADAATIKIPVLLVYAAGDEDVPLADGEQYHKLMKNSELEVIQEAGHFVHIDQSQKVIRLIKGFLS